MPENDIPVRLEVQNSIVRDALEKILKAQDGVEVRKTDDPTPVELLILEVGSGQENQFDSVHSLLNLNTVKEVFLTSSNSDPALLVKALRAGAREFLSQPIQEREILDALRRYRERRTTSTDRHLLKKGQIINVIGSKGGVGTTSIAVNLAYSLAGADKSMSVALIDMNLLFGEIPLFLDIEPSYHWGEITKNVARLDITFLMSVLYRHGSGMYVLPSPSHLNGQEAASPKVMEQLLKLMRTVFDFIIVDAGQASDEVTMKILELSDEVLLVSILSLPCLSNVNRLLRLFYDLGYPQEDKLKIVVNRYAKAGEVSLKDAEKSIDRRIFWTIPNDYKTTMSAINQGKVLSDIDPGAQVTKSIKDLAAALTQKEKERKKTRSLFGWKLSSRK